MLSRLEAWYDKVGVKILYAAGTLLFIYIFFKYIFRLTAPFIIAWVLASLLNPVVTYLHKRLRFPRGIGTILSMLTVLSSVFALLSVIIKQLWAQTVDFAYNFPYYRRQMVIVIDSLQVRLENFKEVLPISSADFSLDSLFDSFLSRVGSFFETMVKQVGQIVIQVPNALVFTIVMLVATFFMTKDYLKIKAFIKAQVPEKVTERFVVMQKGLIGALGGYVKTQLIMLCFTFSICLVGLFILRERYVLLISFCIALFDALPIFGSGAILIPWSIYNIVMGNYSVGIGIFCIYGTIFLTRQIIEPRILSGQIGLYALVTIMAMYIGLKLFGVFGLIIGPVTAVSVKTLQQVGVIPKFKDVPKK